MNIKNFDSRFVALPIKKIIEENENTRTYVFEYSLGAKPGQFVMLWLPGIDEKPFSVAWDDGKEFWLTICRVGSATEELFKLGVGDKVGIRGPLGTHYEWSKGDTLVLVSGGYGAAPMYYVARKAVEDGCKVLFLTGARNGKLLLYLDKLAGISTGFSEGISGLEVRVSTDDGSKGHKGFITEVLKAVLEGGGVDRIFSCGPERMMKVVGQIADEYKIPAWLSIEKYMKCGLGVCGQCSVDKGGDLVCKDGPVISWEMLRDSPEMGMYHRDAQGKKYYF